MKQKDMFVIGAVVLLSAVLSLVVSRFIFSKPADRKQQVEVVTPIKEDFPQPDSKYFNSKALDPTQSIEIGNSNNTDPFKNTGQ